VCRELTKLHEEVVRGTAATLAERFGEARGEITIVIGPTTFDPPEPPDEETLRERAAALVEEGLGAKEAADALAEQLGIPRREAYRIVLEAKRGT
jgi:16S rRNA (cytidine1402-2'-O)-methyltransferase